jgi:hypothetical protein
MADHVGRLRRRRLCALREAVLMRAVISWAAIVIALALVAGVIFDVWVR